MQITFPKNHPMKILSFVLFSLPLLLSAQPTTDDFALYGAASAGSECLVLTPDVEWTAGSAFYREPITLRENFSMELRISFGCQDEWGADGMVFIFSPNRRALGRLGEGIGFQGIFPSLGIEMDTYHNFRQADPEYDHLALLANGVSSHEYGLSSPVRIAAGNDNVEDCREHRLLINWTAAERRLQIYFDGRERMNYVADGTLEEIIGQKRIYWGISAATGGMRNEHRVCFERIEFDQPTLPPAGFEFMTEHRLYRGDFVEPEGNWFEPGTDVLTPFGKREIQKAKKFLHENPTLNLEFYNHTERSDQDLSRRRIAKILKQFDSEPAIGKRTVGFALSNKFADEQGKYRDRTLLRVIEPIP